MSVSQTFIEVYTKIRQAPDLAEAATDPQAKEFFEGFRGVFDSKDMNKALRGKQ